MVFTITSATINPSAAYTRVWLATQYIPPAADQDPMDNWGTYVFKVK